MGVLTILPFKGLWTLYINLEKWGESKLIKTNEKIDCEENNVDLSEEVTPANTFTLRQIV